MMRIIDMGKNVSEYVPEERPSRPNGASDLQVHSRCTGMTDELEGVSGGPLVGTVARRNRRLFIIRELTQWAGLAVAVITLIPAIFGLTRPAVEEKVRVEVPAVTIENHGVVNIGDSANGNFEVKVGK